jgi:pimeloyl-ACP methyl ester carboxylesterase
MLLLLHGGRDAAITFQFLVDALRGRWHVVAPDWRGHGDSEWAPQGYWFQDYLADLDALLDHFSPARPVRLVGHSLGGNVACVYAGVRPERVSRLVSLDGFGIPDRSPDQAPERLRAWLDSWRSPLRTRSYPAVADLAVRLRQANPRLDAERALFLAENLSRTNPDGTVTWSFDPRHRAPFPTVHRFAEWAACFKRVTARVLWVGSGQVFPPVLADEPGGLEGRLRLFPRAGFVRIEGTGHNLHHDAPEAVAAAIEPFLEEDATPGPEGTV